MNITYFASCFVARATADGWEFLQLLRAPEKFMGGTWQLVTGKIEPNKTAWQAALRELREETDLTPLEFYHVDRVNTFYLPRVDSIVHVPMFCAIVSQSAQLTLNGEHTDHRWIERKLFAGHLMWPGERDGFAEIGREILDVGPAKKHLRIKLP